MRSYKSSRDYGTQFGKLIVAYKKWGDRKIVEKDPINELLKLYVKFHKEMENDSTLEEQARHWFKNWRTETRKL